MKFYLNFAMTVLILFTSLVHAQGNVSDEGKEYGAQLLGAHQKRPMKSHDFFKSTPGQDSIVTQSQETFKNNKSIEHTLSQIKTPDNEAVAYAKNAKKPTANKAEIAGLLSPKTADIEMNHFYQAEEKIELYEAGEMGESITSFAALKSISDPMKEGLGGIGQSTNPTVMHGKCQRCTITLGSAFKDCCDLNGIAKGVFGGCRQEEKELANAAVKDKRCNVIQQKYCSKKKFGVCVEKKSAYCCYGSQMGKIIQEIAHQQLGISWGEGKNPNCESLTSDQLSRLNFNTPYARSKLSELVAEYQAAGMSSSTSIQTKIKIDDLQKKLSKQYKKPVPVVKK